MINAFGIAAVMVMVLSYALEKLHRLFVAIFSIGCAAASLYAFLIGSYPFMVAEGIWAIIAFRRFLNTDVAKIGK